MNAINLLEKIKNFYLLFEDDGKKDGISTEQPELSKPIEQQESSKQSEMSEPLKPLEQEQIGSSEPLDDSIKNFFKGLLDDFDSWKKIKGNNGKNFEDFIGYLKSLLFVNISKIDKILN